MKATYTVDGKEYTATLNSYDPSYKVGGEVAMARSGATDERGGSRRMLFNTLKGE